MVNTKRTKLSKIASLITKGYTPTSLGFDYQDTGINFLKIECFKEDGSFIPSKVSHISEECNTKLRRSQLKEGDILFSIAGAVGRVSIVTKDMLPANTNQALSIIRIDRDNIHLPFIKLVLTSPIIKKQLEKKKQGAAQLIVSLKDIGDLEIPLPSFSRQIELSDKFNTVHSIIDHRKRQIEMLDTLIKARFAEMFGEPEIDPMNWNTVNIADVAAGKISNGFFAKRDEYCDDGNIKVLGVTNIVNRMYSYTDNLPRANGTAADIEKYSVKYGDMLFCRSSLVAEGIGKASVVHQNTPANVLFECHVIRLPLNLSKCVPEFMQVLSTTDFFRKQIISQSKTATITTISHDGLLKTMIILPPMKLQKEFLTFVKQVDKTKAEVQKALDEAQLLFDSLMQEHFG